jgi:hypothetical protein
MTEEKVQRIGWVVWPAFLVACAAELLFFSLFDPSDLHLFGRPVEVDRMLVYTLGFFAFWVLGIVSSALTVFLARSPLRAASGRAAGGMPEA